MELKPSTEPERFLFSIGNLIRSNPVAAPLLFSWSGTHRLYKLGNCLLYLLSKGNSPEMKQNNQYL